MVLITNLLHRHGNKLEVRLHKTGGNVCITSPESYHRDASAVVGVVHSQIILLIEAFFDRKDPVVTS